MEYPPIDSEFTINIKKQVIKWKLTIEHTVMKTN